jgi:hypothetical protein
MWFVELRANLIEKDIIGVCRALLDTSIDVSFLEHEIAPNFITILNCLFGMADHASVNPS